ncbi:gliding motility-associated peptidyl-prolyl isomerase GldI [Flavobacterium agricola]|uniref:Peptidyl-prolyl cis-trans isomerase n=1 Tax=Flavobacterium agricola TaxID=2870839 RepID=A0ABY6M3R6_9FLAO|nr:gliding motility-associated peptidyl-prolyl isomerase GldI [Flavobacterium agricola]UYW02520.1 gliding motility-associated peptidyl-prolyl isomerase GldI [Flavobacterium agricola]
MKTSHFYSIFLLAIFITSCNNVQEARYPISQTSSQFLDESIARNKVIINSEEQTFENMFKQDTANVYIPSTKGFWFKYETKVEENSALPVRGDIVLYDYEVYDINGSIIYTKEETQPQRYLVDKETIMTGLRYGIKQLKQGEEATFYFPSHIAYGYHGDNKSIGTNVPLICKVKINQIIKSN